MPVNQQNPQVPDECSVNETMSPFIQRAFVMTYCVGFPRSSVGKEFACNAGDPGSTPGLEDPLEKEMATHSRIPAWRIPWTEEPGRLLSMGSQESDTT